VANEIRVRLTEETFGKLVAGEVVEIPDTEKSRGTPAVKIILADIGWDRMYAAIEKAMRSR
jgi:hypothetical protein